MEKVTVCRNLRDTRKLACAFVRSLRARGGAVVLFDAPMGAGKTTFIRECVRTLGAKVSATSPTFSIINRYAENIFHIDLYRVEEVSELENTDFYEVLCEENFVFVEWSKKFNIDYPQPFIKVKIEVKEDDSRVFDITY